jgi:adenylate kinase
MEKDKQVLILFGSPGAGKGTQASLLAEKLSLYYFETSRILEKEFKKAENLSEDSKERFFDIEGEKYDILNEKKLWTEGILCSPPFVTYLVKKNIEDLHSHGESLILAGSPRTVYEADKLTPLILKLYGRENIKVILIEIGPEEAIFRNSHRKICELMRHGILYSKETEELKNCPIDGSKLMRREGLDDPETIKIRLKEYKERTFPVLEILEKNGIRVQKINGEQPPAGVFQDILEAIK